MLYKRSRLAFGNSSEPCTSSSPSLRMVIFYDRSNTLEHSRKLVAGLAQTLEANRAIQFTAWRFDTLKETSLASCIDSSLQTAEITMLAAAASVPLPAGVEQKLEQWLANVPPANRALFVFLEGFSIQARVSGLPFDRLQTLASRYGVDFFAHIADPETCLSTIRASEGIPATA